MRMAGVLTVNHSFSIRPLIDQRWDTRLKLQNVGSVAEHSQGDYERHTRTTRYNDRDPLDRVVGQAFIRNVGYAGRGNKKE